MNNQAYQQDQYFGLTAEGRVVAYLNEHEYHEDDPLILSQERYNLFDFSNSEYTCELKTRRNLVGTYPSTMVGYNKIKICEDNPDKKYRFYFLFSDKKLYCWDYNRDEYFVKFGGRQDRGIDERKHYTYIPCDKLFFIGTLK